MSTGYSKGTAAGLDTPRGEDWRAQRACSEASAEMFFPVSQSASAARPAKRICERCPVVTDCLVSAIENREAWGVFGGLTAWERREMRVEDVTSRRPVVHPMCPAKLHPMSGPNTGRSTTGGTYCKACKRENGIAAAVKQAADQRVARVEAPVKVRRCGKNHLLAAGNLTKNRKCRTCAANRSALYRERKAEQVNA